MTKDKLAVFLDTISGINAPIINVFGTGLPGMGGSSAYMQGALSSGAEVVLELHRQAALFAHAYRKGAPEKLQAAAQQLESNLLMLSTLSVLDAAQSERLIDDLHALVETHESSVS